MPLLGTLNLANESQIVSTVLIAFVDGVNPCSIWVLSVLLALTLRTGSRKKVFLIGLVFITVTASIYALFIATDASGQVCVHGNFPHALPVFVKSRNVTSTFGDKNCIASKAWRKGKSLCITNT